MSLKFNVDTDLLKKYDRPGPRYTSYPTAPQFHQNFSASTYEEELKRSNAEKPGEPISLYFHLPFCDTLCYFCGCTMIITRSRERIAHYVEVLKKEIEMVSSRIDSSRKVVQLHWGGGTPTYLNPDEIADLMGHIHNHFSFDEKAEISVEIDPRGLSDEHLPVMREAGFNRMSMGVQDFNEKVQKTINRLQPEALTRRILEQGRKLGYESINLDFIYGLPYQTPQTFESTLDTILDINPDRLAMFNYAHVPWLKKHQNVIPENELPSADNKLAMLKMIIERLTESGYVFIGMDHFAKPDDLLSVAMNNHTLHRNFQGYTTYAGAEVFAMGMSSISQLYNSFAQNHKDIKTYEKDVQEGRLPVHAGYQLDDDDKLRRFVIMDLMCNNRLIKEDVNKRFGIDFDSYFADALEKLKPFTEDNLLVLEKDRIIVNKTGRLVIRNMAMAFDRYLEKDMQKNKPLYSRTV